MTPRARPRSDSAACNGSGNGNGNGGAGGGGSGGAGGGGAGGSGGAGGGGGSGVPDMSVPYQRSTVAQMRTAGVSGSYELDGVVAIGLTPSTTSPRLFFQDAAGGDFSAMQGKCTTSNPTHPCAVASTVSSVADGNVVGVRGTYLKSATSGLESFYIEGIVVAGGTTMPAAVTVQLADIERNGARAKWWFQRVRVDLGAGGLKMYDFSPAELKYTGSGFVCPTYFGFGMVPSASSDVAGAACSGTTQPPSAVSSVAPSDEILVGTDFFRSFTASADCACAVAGGETLVGGSSIVSGSVGGILVGDLPLNATTMYQYLAPKSSADAAFH